MRLPGTAATALRITEPRRATGFDSLPTNARNPAQIAQLIHNCSRAVISPVNNQ